MQFWKFSTQALAAILASVSVVSASGPADGQAIADPDSAVVKLATKEFESFLEANPLVLAEFFAPWCGYCKQLGPEFSKAADLLNETHPNIKLAQIDCTEEEELCKKQGIRGYPTLKVMRGSNLQLDYEGPRDAAGIAEFMIRQLKLAVQTFDAYDEFFASIEEERKPYLVQVFPTAAQAKYSDRNETFSEFASEDRDKMNFYLLENDDVIAELKKVVRGTISDDEPTYFVAHPSDLKDARVFSGDFSKELLTEWANDAKVPYFGDINRDTYMVYMGSSLPLGYYFYNTGEERAAVEKFFHEQGKKHVGVINFVGLDASKFGRHAEILNMDPEIVPLFAIQDNGNGRKYGINQTEYPEGPSLEAIETFIDSFLAGEVEAIIKSEPLPTEEEIAEHEVVKLVAHNYLDVLNDTSKDVFVKYFAPWCGHCKKLAPIWEELAGLYGSKNADSKVVIAHLDHTLNDVDTPIPIEGYPTLIFYPANGKVDPKTGLREHILYDQARDLENLIEFVKEKGFHKVDGEELKAAKESLEEEDTEEPAEEPAEAAEADEEIVDHDEL